MSVTFYPATEAEHPQLELNVHNGNGRLLLETLGLPADEMLGQCDAGDFLGRVLVALAVTPEDAGMPAHQLQPGEYDGVLRTLVGDGGAQVWAGGRSPGTLQRHLSKLAELAEYCQRHGHEIAWA